MSEWQPIETAPSDTSILVSDGKLRAIAFLVPTWRCVSGGLEIAVGISVKDKRLDGAPEMGPLTHWMPLPPPPRDTP